MCSMLSNWGFSTSRFLVWFEVLCGAPAFVKQPTLDVILRGQVSSVSCRGKSVDCPTSLAMAIPFR